MRYSTFDGDTYHHEFRLSDAELNKLEVLRSKRLREALRVEDYRTIEIFDDKINLGLTYHRHTTIKLNRCILSLPLEKARRVYLHELTHALLISQGHNGGHDYNFLTLFGVLLLRANGGNILNALLSLRLYDMCEEFVDGIRLAEHPIYKNMLLDEICPYAEFPNLCPIGDYSITLAKTDWDLDRVTAHVLSDFD